MATDDLKARLRQCEREDQYMIYGGKHVSHWCHEAADHIAALEAQLAARDALLTDEVFKYAQAVYPQLLDVETEDALKAVGIYVYGPDAERFEKMFAAAMKARKTLIEATAIASGDYAKGQTDAHQGD